jgi:spore maturation protein CgeB
MKIVLFCHSLLSDWNHGNAHFLRGIATELYSRGHHVRVFEPQDAWSIQNLIREQGEEPVETFRRLFPWFSIERYDDRELDLDRALDGADVVLVHEWNSHELVTQIGLHRARSGKYRLLFHDTHHRSLTDRQAMGRYNLSNFDGVLAFGNVITDIYQREGWSRRAWTWHEAADTRMARPLQGLSKYGDLVWIGNWGDGERANELDEFLLGPVRALGLRARVHGVRYPEPALCALQKSGVEYAGWLPNYRAPECFARFRVTVHVPRQPYSQALQGIPTIRVFEALACGIPLVSAPWNDCEGLFSPGKDFLLAANGEEMTHHLHLLLNDPDRAAELASHGLRTILSRHTCAHRVDELLEIVRGLGVSSACEAACA